MFGFRRLTTMVTAAAACAVMAASGLVATGTAAAAPAKKYPVSWDFRSAIPSALQQTVDPNWAPPGANDPSCRLTKERPNPVVLLNATATTQWAYNAGAPYLANNGYCVYTFNYGNITPIPTFPIQGLADIERSGREISRQIDRILRRTGAKKVDLVGWSQGGGLLPHYSSTSSAATRRSTSSSASPPETTGRQATCSPMSGISSPRSVP